MKIDEKTAEHYVWGNGCDGWHLLKTEGLSVIKERVPSGEAERAHFHTKARQFFFILKGEAQIEMNGSVHALSQNQGIEVPPGIVHKFKNVSPRDVEFLVISSPKSHGDRVDQEQAV
jgi:mannose-6-phosphate isomerase-like protein (cupin superfamily)